VRFAPGVGDDASAFSAFGKAIFHAVTVGGRYDESMSFDGLRLTCA
jgi:hypothetical protein